MQRTQGIGRYVSGGQVSVQKGERHVRIYAVAALEQFRSALRGQLVAAGEADYEEARKVYNGMIDKRPALIVRCADVGDVIAAVNFARDHKLLLAVRGGGHNGGGLGTCDDGLVIDLVQYEGRARRSSRSVPYVRKAAVPWAMSTMRPTPSAWRFRLASCPRPGWPD